MKSRSTADEIYEPIVPPTAIIPTTTTASTQTYIVQEGDILSQIALDVNSTTAELVALNGLENPDVLYIGQKLQVPAGMQISFSGLYTSASTSSIERGGVYTFSQEIRSLKLPREPVLPPKNYGI